MSSAERTETVGEPIRLHGVFTAARDDEQAQRFSWHRWRAWMRARRNFLLVVVAPLLLLASYLYLMAADQYESEAHFIVRSSEPAPAVSSGLGQVLGMAGAFSTTQTEAMSISDYLASHDAVGALQLKLDLVSLFRRPEADVVSKLWPEDPSPERLLKYYRGQVSADYNLDTGITSLRVRAFRPGDAYAIIGALLELGEKRVNALNVRSYNDAVDRSRRQLAEAEDAVAAIETRMTHFRQTRADIDPAAVGQAQIALVSSLQSQLAALRAPLAAMAAVVSPTSPQYVALARQVQALEHEIAAERGKIAGPARSTIAADLGQYEDLRVRQGFAAKQYEAAAAVLEKAREQVLRQQLYVVRVVDPNLPVKALYPERLRILLTAVIGLLLVYAIGWLIAAGVREHAA